MQFFPFNKLVVATIMVAFVVINATAQTQTIHYADIGRPATQEDIGNLGIASGPSGKDLPEGSGTAAQGEPIYYQKCALCHGVNLEGVTAPPESFSTIQGARLAGVGGGGGFGRSGANVYAFVTAIWNTIAVEMPFYKPGTLEPDEIYALTAFILYKNNIIEEGEVMNRETLPAVIMPNRDAFVPYDPDDALDVEGRGCRLPYGFCP